MSTFENNYHIYLTDKSYTMPAWAKAERHEYCEPAFTRTFSGKSGKRSSARGHMILSILTALR